PGPAGTAPPRGAGHRDRMGAGGARPQESDPGGVPAPDAGHPGQLRRRHSLGADRVGDRARGHRASTVVARGALGAWCTALDNQNTSDQVIPKWRVGSQTIWIAPAGSGLPATTRGVTTSASTRSCPAWTWLEIAANAGAPPSIETWRASLTIWPGASGSMLPSSTSVGGAGADSTTTPPSGDPELPPPPAPGVCTT